MYRYDTHDQTLVTERVAQFRDQMERYLAGRLSDDEFLPLRVQNGLYIQRHAPMLRIAIPYGIDRKSTRLNSSHVRISYAVFCLKKKKKKKYISYTFILKFIKL